MYNYVVTAHKPSAVHLSLTANFTGAQDKNLIVTKSNRLVIYLLTPECLQVTSRVKISARCAISKQLEISRNWRHEKSRECVLTFTQLL